MGIGKNIKLARLAKGITQREAAKTLGVGERMYQHYEADNFEPNVKTLCALADLFSVSTDFLLGRLDSPDNYKE